MEKEKSKRTKEQLPKFYDRDLLKVLVRNPYEIYFLWEYSQKTLQKIQNYQNQFNTPPKCILKVFFKERGIRKTSELELPPFSHSYYLRFASPVKEVRGEILYSFRDIVIPIFESAQGFVPSASESFEIHPEWIHPVWTVSNEIQFVESENQYVLSPKDWQESLADSQDSPNKSSARKTLGSSERNFQKQ